MSVDLLNEAPPDVQRVVCVWLRPLGRAATQRLAGDPLPFRLVNRVAGADDHLQGIDIAVISVHTFATRADAIDEANLTHQRMLYLARHPFTNIELSTGTANINFCETVEKPIHQDYGDPNLTRYVARYRIGLDFVATVSSESGS